MTLAEALIALAEGKKVRKKHWEPRYFISLKDNCLYDQDDKDSFNLSNYPTDVWEIYQKPCKHEPDTDANFVIQIGNVKCKHCGVELVAEWKEKK